MCNGIDYGLKLLMTYIFFAVNGFWSDWGTWEGCTVTCGGGDRPRYRECVPPKYGGEQCTGPNKHIGPCNPDPCPVDGKWNPWGLWSDCDVSCGGGIRERERTCQEPIYGGSDCEGPSENQGPCSGHPCPINGKWMDWGGWQNCDASCGGGTRLRERICDSPRYGGKECTGDHTDKSTCNMHHCPIDGTWESWDIWGRCTVTCAGGTRFRSRQCKPPKYSGIPCQGHDSQTEDCNEFPCPIDSEWLTWENWTPCTVTCGGGTQARKRTCIGAQHGGRPCGPHGDQDRECNNKPCPIDGHWLTWGPWGHCTAQCGGGTQKRERKCYGTMFGGNECIGEYEQDQGCNTQLCPVNGVWDPWSDWSACDVSCGGGSRYRNRVCSGPWHGGLDCFGENKTVESCGTITCFRPRSWHKWGPWTPCTVTCGGGTRVRHRACDMSIQDPVYATECVGKPTEEDWCHAYSCTPYAKSCSEWKERGMLETRFAQIAPTSVIAPVWVVCNMSIDPKVGFTQVDHNCTGRTEVRGVDYEAMGGYKMPFKYNVSFNILLEIVRVSRTCKQFIRWECHSAAIKSPYDSGLAITYWKNRNGENRLYWGGADHTSTNCGCGMSESCALPHLKCNCDANDEVLREDSGHVTYKPDLPITEFLAGDTGGENEYGYFTVGPLLCHD